MGKEQVVIACDFCGKTVESTTLSGAARKARNQGWDIFLPIYAVCDECEAKKNDKK